MCLCALWLHVLESEFDAYPKKVCIHIPVHLYVKHFELGFSAGEERCINITIRHFFWGSSLSRMRS